MTKRHMHSDWCRTAVAVLLVALLLSCGGGGGGGGPIFSPGGSAPTVSITSPANLSTGLTGLVVEADASDADADLASVTFYVDGVQVLIDSAAPYSATIDTLQYASGQHVVWARAVDANGNTTTSTPVTLQFAGTRTQPAGFTRDQTYVTGLSSTTAFTQAPAPDGRLFIAEQGGTLRVFKNGVLLPVPFLSLTVDASSERGLLGVALHPNFASNGFVYVYYTATQPTTHNRISRFTAQGQGDVAVSGSEFVLADLPTLGAGNHNGGALHFGTDGKLYVGVGENAVPANSQDLTTPLGKILRFDADGTAADGTPAGDPSFATQTGLARAIWAYGLRNPFTFAVQPGTSRIHINDVGESTWEEINVGAGGANYGWPDSEGPDNVTSGVTAPLFTYKHSAAAPAGSGPGGFFTGQAITGGTFYPNSGPFGAPYQGGYFFADLTSRFIGFLDLANANAAYTFGSVTNRPVDMLAASDGALLVLTQSNIVRFSKP